MPRPVKTDLQFFDFAPFSGERVKTDEGYLEVNVVATAVGVQEYDGSELGGKEGQTMGLYRTSDTVFSDETIKSFSGRPVTIGHDGEMINADTHKVFSFGNVMGDAFKIDNERLGVRLLITDPDTVRRIEDNELTGVSLGYGCDHSDKSGTHDGTKFHAVTDGPMIINHVTLLPKSMPPRVEQARILDKQKKDTPVMTEEELKALAETLAPLIKTMVADALADATKEKADADAEAEEKAKVDAEAGEGDDDDEKADAEEPKTEEEKADAKKKLDAKFDAKVNDAAATRGRVLALTDNATSGVADSNTVLLKSAMKDAKADYFNDEQAIGYLSAMKALDAQGRTDAANGFKNSGGAQVHSLDAIRKMDAQNKGGAA